MVAFQFEFPISLRSVAAFRESLLLPNLQNFSISGTLAGILSLRQLEIYLLILAGLQPCKIPINDHGDSV